MKIGILTFYRTGNYGAMLQAYGLLKFLESEGHMVRFLDTEVQNGFEREAFRAFLRLARSCFSFRTQVFARRWRVFLMTLSARRVARFSDLFPVSKKLRSRRALERESRHFDAIIVGSDQMWNPHWCVPYLPLVFLDFVADGVRRISYAVSFGVPEWGRRCREEAGMLLERFHAISVREDSGKAIVESLCSGTRAHIVLDPTMLHPTSFWMKRARYDSTSSESTHAFFYFLSWTTLKEVVFWRESLSEVSGGIDILDHFTGRSGSWRASTKMVSVEEWLLRVASCSFMLTNSFHGTVFAILFHRPFATVLLNGKDVSSHMNERIISLLSRLGLLNRAIDLSRRESLRRLFRTPIDWAEVDARINEERNRSVDFLRSALR